MRIPWVASTLLGLTLLLAGPAAGLAAAFDDVTLNPVANACARGQPGFQLRNLTKDRPIRATIKITTTRADGQKSERTQVVDINPGEMKSVGCASNLAEVTLAYEVVGAFYLDLLRPEDRRP